MSEDAVEENREEDGNGSSDDHASSFLPRINWCQHIRLHRFVALRMRQQPRTDPDYRTFDVGVHARNRNITQSDSGTIPDLGRSIDSRPHHQPNLQTQDARGSRH